jgi:hypothetical protein
MIVSEIIYETYDPRVALDPGAASTRARRELADVINESARLGAQSAQIYAPEGASKKLRRHITHNNAVAATDGSVLEARAGIERIHDAGEDGDEERGAYPEVGTGIYGERESYIYPRTGRLMVFEINGHTVTARRVKGQPAQHFLRHGYEDILAYLPQRLNMMARQIAEEH